MTLPEDTVKWATKAFGDGRNEEIAQYQDYIDGNHPSELSSLAHHKALGRRFQRFAYNLFDSVITAHTNRLQVTGISADDPDLAAAAQFQWDDNRMDVREDEATKDALSYGDGFVVVEASARENGRVHYWVNDPRNIRVHYSDEVPGELDLAAKRWVGEDGYARLNLYYTDKVDKYISRNKAQGGIITSTSNAGMWEFLEDESFALAVNDTVPVFHLGNKARTNQYGRSEIRLLIPMQDYLNSTLRNGKLAEDFSSFSQKVIMGVKPDSKEEEDLLTTFQSGADRILMLYDENAKIGEFSASNLNMYIDFAHFWETTIFNVSHVPLHYLNGGVAESGEAKRLREAPFVSKITDRQRSFGYVYAEVARYGQRLLGKNVDPGAIRVNWESAAPHSEHEQWELIGLKVSAGLPLRSAMREAGYDTDQLDMIDNEEAMSRVQAQRYFDRGAVDMGFGEEETA